MADNRKEAGQLVLSLPQRAPRYDRASFLVSSANEAAFQTAQAWLKSSDPALIICGPRGAGKTHLAHVLASSANGRLVFSNELAHEDYDPASRSNEAAGMIVLDNFPGGVQPKTLLANINRMMEHGVRVVLTGNGSPGEWAGGLKDLQTRLEAMVRATLEHPDEDLMRQVIVKQFEDRQIEVKKIVIDYAAPRLRRTFEAASAFVALSDKAALAAKQKITVPLVQKIVANLSEGAPDA